MADNIDVTPGVGKTISADDISGVLYQRIKVTLGTNGVDDGDVSSSNPMPTNITGTVPLPTGASTSALQTSGNLSLSSIDGKITTTANGIKVDGSAVTQPVSGTVTANAGTNLNTSLLALDSTVAKDASLTTLNTSVNTLLKPANTLAAVTTLGSITSALPAGTNLLGNVGIDQTTPGTTNGVQVNAALPTGANSIGQVTANQGTSPWVISGTVTAGNASVSTTGTAVPGSATMVGGSDGTNLKALKVSATGVLSIDGSATTQPVSGTFFQATQPVSAASLPLPSGAATETSLAKLTQTQGSTTSGQSGPLIQGAVTTAAPAYTTAQSSPFSLTTTGGLRTDTSTIAGTAVVTGGVAGLQAIAGNVAAGATDSGNPVKVGGEYNSTAPTLTTGQRGDIQLDMFSRQYVNIGPRNSSYIATSTTTVVKSGAGMFYGISLDTNGANGNTATIYDNTAGSGTIIKKLTSGGGTQLDNFPVPFTTGLTVVTVGATPSNYTVYYQ